MWHRSFANLRTVSVAVLLALSLSYLWPPASDAADQAPRPPGVETRAAAGLYVATIPETAAAGSAAPTYYFYLFSPDGRVHRGYGMPKSPGGDIIQFDYAAAAREDPENTGTFALIGGRLVIKMGTRHPSTIVTEVPDSEGNVTIENCTFTLLIQ